MAYSYYSYLVIALVVLGAVSLVVGLLHKLNTWGKVGENDFQPDARMVLENDRWALRLAICITLVCWLAALTIYRYAM